MAGDGGGRRHRGADQMGPAAGTLAASEVAVAGGGRTLARRHQVAVHADAHRTAREPPFEAGLGKDPVQTLRLRLTLHQAGAGDDHRRDHRLAAPGDRRGGAQVLDPAVGAGADEDPVDRDLVDGRARRQAHIVERDAHGLAPVGVLRLARIRDSAGDRHRVLRAVAPGDHRRDLAAVKRHLLVEDRVRVARQPSPMGQGAFPLRVPGRERPAGDVMNRGVVRGDDAGARARLDRHVAKRHPPLEAETPDRRAGIFDGVSGAAGGGNGADDLDDHVLGDNAVSELAFD